MTQRDAVIEAFKVMGGIRGKRETEEWVINKYGNRWKDFRTCMADMVPRSH